MKSVVIPKALSAALICAYAQMAWAADEVAGKIDVAALQNTASSIFQALPSEAQLKEVNPETTKALVALGQKLYFEPRLSQSRNISCNTCHNLSTYGVDNAALSLGVGAKLGGRNSPTVLNAALNASQFWDGRAHDVEEQAGGPLLNPVEMALPDEATAVQRIAEIPGYVEEFKQVFGDDEVSFTRITSAIGAFERTLLTPSRFDAFLSGDQAALNAQELRGLNAFINRGCISCHAGVNLGGEHFQKFGLVEGPYWKFTGSATQDEGRFQVTAAENDRYLFRVPTLRNVEHTYPYFHDGSVASLHDATRIMGMAQLGFELPDQEIDDIVAFLSSLTGELSVEARTLPILPKSEFTPRGLMPPAPETEGVQ